VRLRAGLAVALGLLGLAPAGAAAATTTITMPGKFFSPPRSTIVAGDTIVFRNSDLVTHDVRIAGGVFDSGPLGRFASWSQLIDTPGPYPFLCTLHPFMTGNLDVVGATLAASSEDALAGESLTLTGRAAAGTGHVTVERSVAGGAWTAVAGAGAAPAADGTFTVVVEAVAGASYRVITPAGASQVVTPRITAHIDLHIAVARRGARNVVRVHAMPAAPGLTATLELYARWHFRWRARASTALDAHGHARFRLPASRRAYARVTLSRGARGPKLVYSDVVKLWNGRVAGDPDMIAPRGGGHGDQGMGGGH
jgi:plastocyanin